MDCLDVFGQNYIKQEWESGRGWYLIIPGKEFTSIINFTKRGKHLSQMVTGPWKNFEWKEV
jgi:hypothetical protein